MKKKQVIIFAIAIMFPLCSAFMLVFTAAGSVYRTDVGSYNALPLSTTADTAYWTDVGNYDISWYSNAPGAGNEGNPYQISTAAGLAGLAVLNNELNGITAVDFSERVIRLTESVDISAHLWTPIGTPSNEKYFKGKFDGANNTVKGLTINTASDYQGLFGYLQNGTVKNVDVTDCDISGKNFVGGVVGYNKSFDGVSTVQYCYTSGKVNGTDSVGGVVGKNFENGEWIFVLDCYNTGTVSGINYVGGIIGENNNNQTDLWGVISVESCYNTGTVSGVSYVGGVIGYNNSAKNSYADLDYCYNTGIVNGTSRVGGVAGGNNSTNEGAAYLGKCFNTGFVGGIDLVGGIVGENKGILYGTSGVTSCFNSETISGKK